MPNPTPRGRKMDYEAYEEAGAFDENRAEQLYDAGITPEEAATMTPPEFGIGGYGGTLGYKYANSDINLSDALKFLGRKPSNPTPRSECEARGGTLRNGRCHLHRRR